MTRTTCRVCNSAHLAPVLDLGAQCIAGAFAEPGGSKPVERPIPLELVRCDTTADQDACGLLQIRHTVPGAILYENYWYESGVNQTMTENLHGIAASIEEIVGLEDGDLVLDIGCNDGTLLDGYRRSRVRCIGFDPSDVSARARAKGYEVVNDFFSAEVFDRVRPDQRASAITTIAMFYDLESPAEFAVDVASVLAERGVWVMELHYLPLMLEHHSFDAIVHEHLEYYSLAVIERIVGEAGLAVFDAQINSMNGGSIRLFIGHEATAPVSADGAARVQALRLREFELALDSPEPYNEFAAASIRIRDQLADGVRRLASQGHSIHVYGASTKGNTILQFAGLDNSIIPYAADRNPAKWGSETIRTRIPIISEVDSRAMVPDYYLALPWHFLDEFLERETEFLERGGLFIVPFPEVHVVGSAGRAPLPRS